MKLSRPTVESAAVDFDTVDLSDPKLYSHGDPHPIWHAMREREPVRWHKCANGLGFWSITRFVDVDRVLREYQSFTSQRGSLLCLLGTDDPAGGRQMAVTDPPRHTRMREPLQRALVIKAVERQTAVIRVQIRRLLATWTGQDTCDFAATMARLPMAVTGTMMGLPPSDWSRLTHLTTMSVAPDDPEFQVGGDPAATLRASHRELFGYFQEQVRQRAGTGGDDLISLLLAMEVDGRRLHPSEVVSNCYSLLLGANVTTPHVPTAAVLEMVQSGGYRYWRSHPELIPTGIEEALRWATPAGHFLRYATRDVTVGGVEIAARDPVVVWLGSADRDSAAFPDPYTFDLGRRPNRHIAFGLGPHYCVGHTVARVSLRVLFEELLRHVVDVEPAGPVEHLCSNFVAGIKHLPLTVTFAPGADRVLAEG
jgi:cytochrome P450